MDRQLSFKRLKLRTFRNRDHLNRTVEAATKCKRKLVEVCIETADAQGIPEGDREAYCRLTRRLFNDPCDEMNASAKTPEQLRLIDEDIEILLPRIRKFTDAHMVADYDTIERLIEPGNGPGDI